LRLLGSALRVLHGFVPQFRFRTVIRQVCKRGIQGCRMQMLECPSDGAMQRASLPRQQPCSDRLLGERVAESKLLR
jgi:hypothetical protein